MDKGKLKLRLLKKNGIAKALLSPTHSHKIVPDKRRKILDKLEEKEHGNDYEFTS